MPPELTTFFTGLIPFLDIKLAVPIGRSLGLSSTSALIFGVAGALVLPALMLMFLDPFVKYMEKKSKIIHKYTHKIFDKTQRKHSKNFQRFGTIFIIIIVAIPIPGSGAGTGAIIAYLFGVDYWKAFAIMIAGVSLSGILINTGLDSLQAIINSLN